MHLSLEVLTGSVAAAILALIAGCAPPTTQSDGSQAVEGQNGTAAGASEKALPNSDTQAESPSSGISVDIGGGEGVDIDVDLPTGESKQGRSGGKDGVQVDIGDGAVDVRIGSGNGDTE